MGLEELMAMIRKQIAEEMAKQRSEYLIKKTEWAKLRELYE